MATLVDLHSYVDRLLRAADDDGAFLIITVSGTEDFVQLIADCEGVEIDFPLITGRQKGFEWKFRSIAEFEGCPLSENRGDDGARFLDVELPADSAEVSRIVELFLVELFGVGPHTELDFEGDCLETNH
jgi:hypothetical protein